MIGGSKNKAVSLEPHCRSPSPPPACTRPDEFRKWQTVCLRYRRTRPHPSRRGFWRRVEGNLHSRVDSLVRRSLQRTESFARTTGSFIMSFELVPCPLPATFSSVTPLYDRSLLSAAASHNAVPPPLPVFNLCPSSPIELPTVNIPSPVPRGKKSSRSLATNSVSVLASSDSSPLLKNLLPHHRKQLLRAWTASPRIPTVNSRRAWAKARSVSPVAVHAWFHSRKSRSKKRQNEPIGEGTYDLAVGNPNDGLDINEETHPDTFLLSPAADSFLSTPSLSTLSLSTPSLSTPSLSTPSLVPYSPIFVTNGFVPGSSSPSPTVPIVSARKAICPKKVAAKPKPTATSIPTGKWMLSKISTAHSPVLL